MEEAAENEAFILIKRHGNSFDQSAVLTLKMNCGQTLRSNKVLRMRRRKNKTYNGLT